jgi:hypothetical protein
MIEGISAVTLGHLPLAVRFYCALGFEVLRSDEQSSFTSFRAGASYLNLVAQFAERRWPCWGRVIFYVGNFDALCERVLAAACQNTAPRDAEWGERIFHLMTLTATNLVSRAFCGPRCNSRYPNRQKPSLDSGMAAD